MSAYIPEIHEVRERYIQRGFNSVAHQAVRAVEFDKWLDNLRAHVWQEGFDAGGRHWRTAKNPYKGVHSDD